MEGCTVCKCTPTNVCADSCGSAHVQENFYAISAAILLCQKGYTVTTFSGGINNI